MMKQKRSNLFRALLCSSALVGMASRGMSQDGVARPDGGLGQPGGGGPDGVVDLGGLRNAQMPDYSLQQYFGPGNPDPIYTPPRRTWQDQIGPRYRMETRIGEWLGSDDQGSSAVNVMLPFAFNNSNTVLFVDGRGTVTYDGGGAGSIGAGIRYFDEDHNRIFGVSGWYDYDDGNARNYHQAGVSIESLGRWVDFRANGYFVLNDETNILAASPTGNAIPDPNSPAFLVEIAQRVESSYNGFNAEIGGPTPLLGRYGFDTYVGGYYFGTEDAEDVAGVQVRNEAQITDDLRMGINVTHDDTFDTTVFGTVVLQLPDGRPQTWFRPKRVQDKLLDRVERRYRTMTNSRTKLTQVSTNNVMAPSAAGNGGMITVNNVIFVDPNSLTNGTGTFANPFNTITGFPTLAPNTLVIVRSGATQGSIGLAGDSLLYSEAFINQNPLMLMTSFGSVMLPSLNANATVPTLSNPAGGPIVRLLGDNTEVAGLIFDGSTLAGPANNIIVANGVQGVSIHNNEFRNYNTAIDLRNVTGTIAAGNPTSIHSNNFFGATGLSFNGFNLQNNGIGTLDLEIGATEYNLLVSGGSATGNISYGNSGEDINGNGRLDAGEDRNANLTLDEGAAYRVTALNRAAINMRAFGNTLSAEPDVNGDGLLNSEDINGNNVLDAGEDLNGNGVLDYGDDRNQNGQRDIGSGSGFVITAGPTGSQINLALVDNTIDRNIGDAIQLNANESIINAGLLGEDVNGNGRLDGFEDANRNGILDLTEDTNGNGVLDPSEDVNGNGILDPTEDRDGDGLLDPTEDINGNGILDFGEDRNLNGRLDLSEDTNGNGVLDLSEDTNGNGRLDLSEDRNSNGVLDLGEDLDGDGALDRGEDAGEDLNGNGMLDTGEDLNGDGFLNLGNANNRLDGGFVIRNNTITRNGRDGIRVNSTNNATVNMIMTSNSVGSLLDRTLGNGGIGLNVNADSGLFDAQIGYIYHEDVNLNGVLDPGEDTNFNGRLDTPIVTDGNQFVGSAGGGLNFDLTGTAIGQVNIIGNSIVGVGGGAFDFLAVGGPATTPANDLIRVPLTFQNSSAAGIQISNVLWNLNGAGLIYDPVDQLFTPQNSTDVTAGLISANGSTNPVAIPNPSSQFNLGFNSFDAVNGILDGSEDLNANGVLDAGEDANGNGVLDFGEDTNMNGILDPGEDISDVFSFIADLDPIGFPLASVDGPDLIGSRFTINFSHGQVLTGSMQAVPGNANASMFVPDPSDLGTGHGVAFNVSQNAALQPSILLANTIRDFGGSGVFAASTEEGDIRNLSVQFNTITGNGSNNGLNNFQSGISLRTGSSINARLTADVQNNIITNNLLSGLDVVANGGTLTLIDVFNNQFDANGAGISLSGAQSAEVSARITGNMITNSVTTNGTTGHGIFAVANTLSTVELGEIADNTINNNAGDGINVQANSNGTLRILASEDVNRNGVLDLGEDANEDVNGNGILDSGEDVNGDGFLNVGNGNGVFDRGLFQNEFNNNVGTAFLAGGTGGNLQLGTVSNNLVIMNQAGLGGFAINATNTNIIGAFTGNTVTGDTATNPTPGTGFVSTTSGGQFNISVGGPNAADGNLFSQLRGAGIAFELQDSGSGAFVIQNNEIRTVIDDNNPNTPFSGDGIHVSLTNSNMLATATATLTRSEISDNRIGNAATANLGTNGSGISVNLTDDTVIEDLLIARNQIGSAGNDNTVLGIGVVSPDAGIEFNRLGDARLNAVNPRPGDLNAVILDGNIVQMSGQTPNGPGVAVPGLSINVANGIRDDIDFDIRNNEFSGGTGDGVALITQADASLSANMRGNLIENNTLSGINMDGVEIVIDDLETQGGTWIQNTIRNNGLHGIQINSVSGTVIPLVIGQNGTDPLTGLSLGNVITDNGLDGIEINGGGSVQILNNLIARNGSARNLALGSLFDSAGIDINADGIGLRNALIQNNTISDNAGDGLELRARGLANMTIVGLGNAIDNNSGRGVDLLVQSSAIGNVRFGDGTNAGMNRITSNGEEGFYVVTSASLNQDQTANSAVALLSDGAADLLNTPDLVLDVDRNEISGNNILNANTVLPFDGGGLSLRIGTSGSLTNRFAGTIIADTTGDVLGDGSGIGQFNGVGANNDLIGNGRTNARIRNNTFEGNLGEDVYIQSFVSTVDPIASAGAWDQNQFNPTAYQTDPLARLNLVFTGNTGNSIEVDEVGANYSNAEGTFKSRLNNIQAPNLAGPFPSATRRRNAQRVAARGTGADMLDPLVGPDILVGPFQYPGVGASTFRIESDFDVSGFQTGDIFQIDGTPIPPTFNAAGENFLNAQFGELGYGWGAVAPGTFQFDTPFIGVAP